MPLLMLRLLVSPGKRMTPTSLPSVAALSGLLDARMSRTPPDNMTTQTSLSLASARPGVPQEFPKHMAITQLHRSQRGRYIRRQPWPDRPPLLKSKADKPASPFAAPNTDRAPSNAHSSSDGVHNGPTRPFVGRAVPQERSCKN